MAVIIFVIIVIHPHLTNYHLIGLKVLFDHYLIDMVYLLVLSNFSLNFFMNSKYTNIY
jgi:hypothetical protein